jgi:hypothetical protein
MFGFLRWLFLMAIIAALAGFMLTYRFHGQTSAEGVCRLSGSTTCVQLASRWGERARRLEARFDALRDQPAVSATPRPSPRPRLTVTDATRTHEAPPLDRHTPQERQALDRILAQRGSQ